MWPASLSFVDVETTGTSFSRDRVIEIGILRVENGQLVSQFSSLIDPQTYISPFITEITGITSLELEKAPTFYSLKNRIFSLLEGSVLVAHNARFDYGFLKSEFRRYSEKLSLRHLCTVKLFRSVFPDLPSHNLDSLISHLSLDCPRRHRALYDAAVLWQFFQKLQDLPDPDIFSASVSSQLRSPSLPPGLSSDQVNTLPHSPGVYIFYGQGDSVLYVGQSVDIKNRVRSHFTDSLSRSRENRLHHQVTHIESITTTGSLGAALLESRLIKKLMPVYNRALRRKRELVLALPQENTAGYKTVILKPAVLPGRPEDFTGCLGIFKSRRQAQSALLQICSDNGLCPRLMGLQKSAGACFDYHLGKCSGACMGREPVLKYNLRFLGAFSDKPFKPWPFPGPIQIIEESGNTNQAFIVDNWCVVEGGPDNIPGFDLDTYRILYRYLDDPRHMAGIRRATLDVCAQDPDLPIRNTSAISLSE